METHGDAWKTIPEGIRSHLAEELHVDESLVSAFAPDLDAQLRFQPGLVVMTNRRLLSLEPETAEASPPAREAGVRELTPKGRAWRCWPLAADLQLRESGSAAVGTLELVGPQGRVAQWRFTPGRSPDVRRFVERHRGLLSGRVLDEPAEGDKEEAEEPLPGARSTTLSLLRLWWFARRHAVMILVGFFLTLLTTFVSLIPPYLTMPLLDKILIPYQGDYEAVLATAGTDPAARAAALDQLAARHQLAFAMVPWYLGGLAGAAILAWALSWVQGWVSNRVSERISADLRNTTYAHLLRLSLEYFGGKRTGDLMSRISSDTDRICVFLSDTAVDFISDALLIVGTAAALTSIDPLLGLATFATFPLIGWLILWVRNHLSTGFARGYRAWDTMTSMLADTIPGIRVVKAFAQESHEIQKFAASNDRILKCNDRVNAVWTFFWPLVVLLNQFGLLVIWALGVYRIHSHLITVGVLTAFITYIGRFYMRLESMTRMFTAVQRAAASTLRVFEILDRVSSVPEPARPTRPGRVRGEIELRHVSFRYGAREVIHDLGLRIRPGEMIGVVGPSGAGKTTLVNLVCRFYDVGEGSILVDGTDIRDFPVEEYRRNIGIV
ncbi:MAG: ABC transporter transmembrane domain-containing protein, partial [Thermoguttaceae bacterium]